MNRLPFGPFSQRSLMVCIDMQRLFMQPGEWYVESALKILDNCYLLARTGSERCLFTRFITAANAEQAHGAWQRYYRRWQSVTRDVVGDELMHIHPQLQSQAAEERCFDKTTHDAFDSDSFEAKIRAAEPDALVLFGIETDVCVLATALSAIDLGYRVVVVRDAVASSDPVSHEACLAHIYPRFDQQLEITDTRVVIDAWKAI